MHPDGDRDGRQPSLGDEPLARHRVFDTDDFAVAEAQLSQMYVPQRMDILGDGPFGVRINAGSIGSLVVTYSSFACPVLVRSPDLANAYAVLVPINGSTVLIGQRGASAVITPSIAGIFHYESAVVSRSLPKERPLKGAPTGGSMISLRVARDALDRHLGRMLGGPVRHPVRFAMTMDQAPLLGGLSLALNLLNGPGDPDDRPLVAVQVEQAIYTALLLTQPNNYSERLRQEVVRGDEPHAVRFVRDMIESSPELPHTVASMAEQAGISVRALQEAFRRHAGTSPSSYLREVRLAKVRADLLAGGGHPHASVTEVALRWGFMHPGRFAARYRERYGEAPSETLRRASRGLAAQSG